MAVIFRKAGFIKLLIVEIQAVNKILTPQVFGKSVTMKFLSAFVFFVFSHTDLFAVVVVDRPRDEKLCENYMKLAAVIRSSALNCECLPSTLSTAHAITHTFFSWIRTGPLQSS